MDAGVDGIEVHAVHEGYTLDQFALKTQTSAPMNTAAAWKTATALRQTS